MISNSFWSMGGYARYIWLCVAFACAVLLAWNVWAALRYLAAARQRAARAMAMAASDSAWLPDASAFASAQGLPG